MLSFEKSKCTLDNSKINKQTNKLQPIVKVVGALLRYLYNDAVLFSDVTIDLMTIADKYNLKALFNRCDFYIAQALRSCQLTGEDVKVNFILLQFRAVGRSERFVIQ